MSETTAGIATEPTVIVPPPPVTSLEHLVKDLVEVRRRLDAIDVQIETLAAADAEHDARLVTHDLRFRTVREELSSLATWRNRIENALGDLAREQRESNIAVNNLVSVVTKDRLLTERKDRKLNAVLNALVLHLELGLDLTIFDDPTAPTVLSTMPGGGDGV